MLLFQFNYLGHLGIIVTDQTYNSCKSLLNRSIFQTPFLLKEANLSKLDDVLQPALLLKEEQFSNCKNAVSRNEIEMLKSLK